MRLRFFTFLTELALYEAITATDSKDNPVEVLEFAQRNETTLNPRLEFACPASIDQAANADENQKEWYDSKSAAISKNVTEFLQVYRHLEEYDNWGHNYEQVKQGMYSFKSKYFIPNLTNGMTIYESACGIGLNLLLTLEILEDANIKGLIIYGNEYVTDSVTVANQLLKTQKLPGDGVAGSICQADSTNLQHIPSEAFDLVYTGYITPIMNPLGLVESPELHNEYAAMCDDPEKLALNKQAQALQNAWYRSWVEEMIRIAKPGAPVIIEEVSYPKCKVRNDWGGVSQRFWKASIELYGWDIDLDSIKFEDEHIFGNRYHVFMRKRIPSHVFRVRVHWDDRPFPPCTEHISILPEVDLYKHQ